MRITCPACQASYQIPDHLLAKTPERVRCARCGAEWAWARAVAPAEAFDLPDLFSDNPAPNIAREAAPDLSGLTDLNPPRERIGSPVFDLGPTPSLPPLGVEPPPAAFDSSVAIPNAPFPREPKIAAPVTPVAVQPPAYPDSPVEIPQAPPLPLPREPVVISPGASRPTVSNLAHERAMRREETFRRVIETTRQQSLAAAPARPSRRPQIIAILAVVALIVVIFAVHFAMVYGVAAKPAG